MARSSIYPTSVTPGIPKLGEKPIDWNCVKFRDVLTPIYRQVDLIDDEKYKLIIAKRNRGGIVERSVLKGKQIKTKSQFQLRYKDFLIAKRQIVHGACGVVPKQLDGSIVSNEYSVLNVNDCLLLDYLNYYSHTIHFQQTCFQSSIGVDVEKMVFKLDEWLDWEFYLPPLDEQRKIAEILSTWDEAIQTTEKLIAALEKRKKGLMQCLLTGQVRFPGFTEEWKEVKLGELANINTSNVTSVDKDKEFRYIEISAVEKGTILIPEHSIKFNDLPSRAKRCFDKNDILMSTVRPNLLGYALCDFSANNYLCSTGFAVISAKALSDAKFIYQYLYSYHIQSQLNSYLIGSNYPAINSNDVCNLKLFCPINIDERKMIAEALTSFDNEIKLLNQRVELLNKQKQGLMQRLLTGQVRVSV